MLKIPVGVADSRIVSAVNDTQDAVKVLQDSGGGGSSSSFRKCVKVEAGGGFIMEALTPAEAFWFPATDDIDGGERLEVPFTVPDNGQVLVHASCAVQFATDGGEASVNIQIGYAGDHVSQPLSATSFALKRNEPGDVVSVSGFGLISGLPVGEDVVASACVITNADDATAIMAEDVANAFVVVESVD